MWRDSSRCEPAQGTGVMEAMVAIALACSGHAAPTAAKPQPISKPLKLLAGTLDVKPGSRQGSPPERQCLKLLLRRRYGRALSRTAPALTALLDVQGPSRIA